MIEVLFGESEAGAMRVAKKENRGWIEGTAEEVICLGFLLDIGDILGDNQLGVGDWWYAKRIDYFI